MNPSPVKIREPGIHASEPPFGHGRTYRAATIRIHFGPNAADVRLFAAGSFIRDGESIEELERRVRHMLADHISESIKVDNWSVE